MSQPSFNLVKILFPSFNGLFLKDPGINANFNQGYRVSVNILSDHREQIIFGVQIESEEISPDGHPVVSCSVDALAEVEFTTVLTSPLKEINQIPLLANILAMLFPFMREKVSYFMSNNMILLTLPPINTFEVIKGVSSTKETAVIRDMRKPIAEIQGS